MAALACPCFDYTHKMPNISHKGLHKKDDHDKIIPEIVNKWPRIVRDGETPTVFIQQDNAWPHIGVDDPEFTRAATAVISLQIKPIMQPPMSPDLNLLDLFFFIQFNLCITGNSARHMKNYAPMCLKPLISTKFH